MRTCLISGFGACRADKVLANAAQLEKAGKTPLEQHLEVVEVEKG